MDILHVDNSLLFENLFKSYFEDISINYFFCKRQKEAIEILQRQNIDLIITAIELVDTSADNFIKFLNESEFSNIPVLVLTSKDIPNIRQKMYNLGIVDYLLKQEVSKAKILRYVKTIRESEDLYIKMNRLSYAVVDADIRSIKNIKLTLSSCKINNVDYYITMEELISTRKKYDVYIIDFFANIKKENLIYNLRELYPKAIIIALSSKYNYKILSNAYIHGANDFIEKPFISTVFMAKLKSNVKSYILLRELEEKKNELKELAIHDGLTGLYNHVFIRKQLDCEVDRSLRYDLDLSVIIFDIDDFKAVNDTYGHLAGDSILKVVSSILSENIRNCDFIGRYGGEEFLLILPETDLKDAFLVGNKLRDIVEKYIFNEYENLSVTISGGVSQLSENDSTDLIRLADKQLYYAKNNGKNKISSLLYKTSREESELVNYDIS